MGNGALSYRRAGISKSRVVAFRTSNSASAELPLIMPATIDGAHRSAMIARSQSKIRRTKTNNHLFLALSSPPASVVGMTTLSPYERSTGINLRHKLKVSVEDSSKGKER